ncbi:hypothetical protein TNCV_4459041 [Trichonephila clavipes]|nr:hypothetical protein TNCV_4459041 [Trichonephila clavipes]
MMWFVSEEFIFRILSQRMLSDHLPFSSLIQGSVAGVFLLPLHPASDTDVDQFCFESVPRFLNHGDLKNGGQVSQQPMIRSLQLVMDLRNVLAKAAMEHHLC